MSNYYRTSEIAKMVGIHPNTVRLYEELKLIPKPERLFNGYRVFTEFHLDQFNLARRGLQVAVLQNGLRKQVIEIIKVAATANFDKASQLTDDYIQCIQCEMRNAEEAIAIAKEILTNESQIEDTLCLTRKQTADYLQITTDTLRNWELNGLLTVKRKQNGYRIYTDADIKRLKVIRSLRCANYSISAILRFLKALSRNSQVDIRKVIDTPEEGETIVSICDKLLTSLNFAESNAKLIYNYLQTMKQKHN